jgi:deoxyribonuclease V
MDMVYVGVCINLLIIAEIACFFNSLGVPGTMYDLPPSSVYDVAMRIPDLPHDWNVTPSSAIGIQRQLKGAVRTDLPLPLDRIRFVAGVDVSMTRFDSLLTAGVVIWDRTSGQVVETASAQLQATFPYIPGLLSFREIPALLQAIASVRAEPDIWLVDGHGIAHPRRLGIAAHLGVLLNRPTVGVAKSRLTGTYAELGDVMGSETPLVDDSEQIGTVLRSKTRSNPLFISPGHLIDLLSAVDIVRACLRGYRLPEPTRLAHQFVNEVRVQKSPGFLSAIT